MLILTSILILVNELCNTLVVIPILLSNWIQPVAWYWFFLLTQCRVLLFVVSNKCLKGYKKLNPWRRFFSEILLTPASEKQSKNISALMYFNNFVMSTEICMIGRPMKCEIILYLISSVGLFFRWIVAIDISLIHSYYSRLSYCLVYTSNVE